METHYAVLNVSSQATQKDIEKAYKKEALKWHPDRKPPAEKAAATERFQRMAEAYQVLKDEQSRLVYDRTLLARHSPPSHDRDTATPVPRPPTQSAHRRAASGVPPPAPTSPPRRDSFSRTASRSPPTSRSPPHSSSSAHYSASFGPNPSAFRPPPPPAASASSHPRRRPPVDPFQIFNDAWGGRNVDDIVNELKFAVKDPDAWRSGKRSGGVGGDSQSWDDGGDRRDQQRRPSRADSASRAPYDERQQQYTPMDRLDRSQSRAAPPLATRQRSASVLGARGADGKVNSVSEIQLTTYRVERLANGSVHMSREMKTQKIGDDGTVHVRHRRQNAGVDYDDSQDMSRQTYGDRPPLKILTSTSAGVRPSFSQRESPTRGASPAVERPRSAYGSRSGSMMGSSSAPGSSGPPNPRMMPSGTLSRQGSYVYTPSPTSASATHGGDSTRHVFPSSTTNPSSSSSQAFMPHHLISHLHQSLSSSPQRRSSTSHAHTPSNLSRTSSSPRLPGSSTIPTSVPTHTPVLTPLTRSGSVGPGMMYGRARARSFSRTPLVNPGYDSGYF